MALCENGMVFVNKNCDLTDIFKYAQRKLFVCNRRDNGRLSCINLKRKNIILLAICHINGQIGFRKVIDLIGRTNEYFLGQGILCTTRALTSSTDCLCGNILGMAYLANPGLYYTRDLTGSAIRTSFRRKGNSLLASFRDTLFALDNCTTYTATIGFL